MGKLNINKIIERIKANQKVKAIILFGSYAKKTHKKKSDIDLCVVAEYNLSEKDKTNILSNSWNNIDLCLFQELPITIKMRVLKEGKILYSSDNLFIDTIKKNCIWEYLDFRPLINRYCQAVLGVTNV